MSVSSFRSRSESCSSPSRAWARRSSSGSRSSPSTSSWLLSRSTSESAEGLDLGRVEIPPLALAEPLDRQPRVAAAAQALDGVADRLAHALDLMLSSLVDRKLDARGRTAAHPSRSGGSVLELDAVGQAAERGVVRFSLHVGDVHLFHFVARVGQPLREWAP